VRLESYASDALEDAMQLASVKSINSFSFRDCINTMTEIWGQCYNYIAKVDQGFYSTTIKLKKRLTHMTPYVRNTITVYTGQGPTDEGFSRKVYKASGQNDMQSQFTYYISGNDLYCPDAEIRNVYCEYMPEPPFITFTKNNRDPKLFDEEPEPWPNHDSNRFGIYDLVRPATPTDRWVLQHRIDPDASVDITDDIVRENWDIDVCILDFPYMFVTYKATAFGAGEEEFECWIWKNLTSRPTKSIYNPLDYTGHPSNVRFVNAKFNDYTGMGVQVEDFAAPPAERFKELGWTPDTLLVYPTRLMYNFLMASLAKRFAELNGSTVMAVESALASARLEMSQHLKKNQSGFFQITNVNGLTIGDLL
jgi:hypothetical protein